MEKVCSSKREQLLLLCHLQSLLCTIIKEKHVISTFDRLNQEPRRRDLFFRGLFRVLALVGLPQGGLTVSAFGAQRDEGAVCVALLLGGLRRSLLSRNTH